MSEMVSQARLGETAEVLEARAGFLLLRAHVDGYTGWADARQFLPAEEIVDGPARFTADDLAGEAVCVDSGAVLLLPLGTPLPGWDGEFFFLNGERWRWRGAARETPRTVPAAAGAAAVAYAARHLRAPYLWGGRTVFGVDCSGLTQAAWAAQGARLPRDSMDQVEHGAPVREFSEIREGDLAFFRSGKESRNARRPSQAVTHTGICAGDGWIIHASGMVRRDRLTPEGIVDSETGALTHRLVALRRFAGGGGGSGEFPAVRP